MLRKSAVLSLLAVCMAVCALFAMRAIPARAHYCDDHYSTEADRSACWWRYWNDRQTDQDRQLAALFATAAAVPTAIPVFTLAPLPTPSVDGTYCNAFYTVQTDRENCWWRYHNNLPLSSGGNAPEPATTPVPRIPQPAADAGQAGSPAGAYATVSAGIGHTCGLRTDGTVTCWGLNDHGQSTPPDGTFKSVDAGGWHTCGVRGDGSVNCWGFDANHQTRSPAGTFAAVSAGTWHSCGVQTDGTVACWGLNHHGEATPPGGTFHPYYSGIQGGPGIGYGRSMPPGGTFQSVSAEGRHACGLRTDGTLACWGSNEVGQTKSPAATFTTVSAGTWHTCGVQTDGTAACWGHNNVCRELADASVYCWDRVEVGPYKSSASSPAGVFTTVSAGQWHSCGLRIDRTAACWGDNRVGQTDAPAGVFTTISAGHWHTCAIRSDGSVTCWGNNVYGESTPPLAD